MAKFLMSLSVSLLFLTACISGGNKSVSVRWLSSTKTVRRDTSRLISYPYKIKLADSLVFVLDLRAGDGSFVQVFSYPELKYITSIGKKGRGPNELLTLPCFDIYEGHVYLLDPHKMFLMRYALHRIAAGEDRPDTVVAYPPTLGPILSYKITSRGLLVAANSRKRRIAELSVADTTPLWSIDLPDYADMDPDPVPEKYELSLWNSVIGCRESPRMVVNATQLGDLLEIYRENGEGVISIIGKGGLPGVIRAGRRVSIGKMDGFSDVQIYGNRIYALYSGADRSEMYRLERKGRVAPSGCDHLLIYDSVGTVLAQYRLDCHVSGFDIDEDNGVLIMVDPNSEEPICTAPLPEIGIPESVSN